jgi:hypothetical protein
MNTAKNQKKKWSAPKVIDLDVKNTNSGTLNASFESNWISLSSLYPIFAPAS